MIGFLTARAWQHVPLHRAIVAAIRDHGEEVRVFSPEEVAIDIHAGMTCLCNDKLLQAVVFARGTLPHPRTLFSYQDSALLLRRLPSTPTRWTMKPVHGQRGRGVKLSDTSHKAAWGLGGRVNETASRWATLVQEWIDHPGQPRHHVRCDVIGGHTVHAGVLTAPAGRLLTNFAQGATWKPLPTVPTQIATLAETASAAVGADCTGVDLIIDGDDRWWVLECNEMPSLGRVSRAALAS